MFRHASSTGTFFSLFSTDGNVVFPSHSTLGARNDEDFSDDDGVVHDTACMKFWFVAESTNADSPADSTCLWKSCFVLGHSESSWPISDSDDEPSLPLNSGSDV